MSPGIANKAHVTVQHIEEKNQNDDGNEYADEYQETSILLPKTHDRCCQVSDAEILFREKIGKVFRVRVFGGGGRIIMVIRRWIINNIIQ